MFVSTLQGHVRSSNNSKQTTSTSAFNIQETILKYSAV